MVTGVDTNVETVQTETTETATRQGATTTFEDENWGVFLKNGGSTPTLIASVKGKGKAKTFLSEYLSENPKVGKENIVARSLGKPVPIRTREIVTL